MSEALTPRERELLTEMRNCYAASHADFEETLEMICNPRGLSAEDVKAMLVAIRMKYRRREYKTLRSRFPDSFPV
jgi:hypothetical protein